MVCRVLYVETMVWFKVISIVVFALGRGVHANATSAGPFLPRSSALDLVDSRGSLPRSRLLGIDLVSSISSPDYLNHMLFRCSPSVVLVPTSLV